MSRATPYLSKPSINWCSSFETINNTTLFLVSRSGPAVFDIKDENDGIFRVVLGNPHKCNCPLKTECPHIVFCLHKVLRVSREHPLCYQTSLTDGEFDQVISGSTSVNPRAGLRKRDVSAATAIRLKREADKEQQNASEGINGAYVNRQELSSEVEECCPICQDEMTIEQALTWCRKGCGNNIHAKCMLKFTQYRQGNKQEPGCPLCREPWDMNLLRADCQKKSKQKMAVPTAVYCSTCTCTQRANFFRCIECTTASLKSLTRTTDFCPDCFERLNPQIHAKHHFLRSDASIASVGDVLWDPVHNPLEAKKPRVDAATIRELQTRELSVNDYDMLLQLDAERNRPPPELCSQLIDGLRLCIHPTPAARCWCESQGGGGGDGGVDTNTAAVTNPDHRNSIGNSNSSNNNSPSRNSTGRGESNPSWMSGNSSFKDKNIRILPCGHVAHQKCIFTEIEQLAEETPADLSEYRCPHEHCGKRIFPFLNRKKRQTQHSTKAKGSTADTTTSSGSSTTMSMGTTSRSSNNSNSNSNSSADSSGGNLRVGLAGIGLLTAANGNGATTLANGVLVVGSGAGAGAGLEMSSTASMTRNSSTVRTATSTTPAPSSSASVAASLTAASLNSTRGLIGGGTAGAGRVNSSNNNNNSSSSSSSNTTNTITRVGQRRRPTYINNMRLESQGEQIQSLVLNATALHANNNNSHAHNNSYTPAAAAASGSFIPEESGVASAASVNGPEPVRAVDSPVQFDPTVNGFNDSPEVSSEHRLQQQQQQAPDVEMAQVQQQIMHMQMLEQQQQQQQWIEQQRQDQYQQPHGHHYNLAQEQEQGRRPHQHREEAAPSNALSSSYHFDDSAPRAVYDPMVHNIRLPALASTSSSSGGAHNTAVGRQHQHSILRNVKKHLATPSAAAMNREESPSLFPSVNVAPIHQSKPNSVCNRNIANSEAEAGIVLSPSKSKVSGMLASRIRGAPHDNNRAAPPTTVNIPTVGRSVAGGVASRSMGTGTSSSTHNLRRTASSSSSSASLLSLALSDNTAGFEEVAASMGINGERSPTRRKGSTGSSSGGGPSGGRLARGIVRSSTVGLGGTAAGGVGVADGSSSRSTTRHLRHLYQLDATAITPSTGRRLLGGSTSTSEGGSGRGNSIGQQPVVRTAAVAGGERGGIGQHHIHYSRDSLRSHTAANSFVGGRAGAIEDLLSVNQY